MNSVSHHDQIVNVNVKLNWGNKREKEKTVEIALAIANANKSPFEYSLLSFFRLLYTLAKRWKIIHAFIQCSQTDTHILYRFINVLYCIYAIVFSFKTLSMKTENFWWFSNCVSRLNKCCIYIIWTILSSASKTIW